MRTIHSIEMMKNGIEYARNVDLYSSKKILVNSSRQIQAFLGQRINDLDTTRMDVAAIGIFGGGLFGIAGGVVLHGVLENGERSLAKRMLTEGAIASVGIVVAIIGLNFDSVALTFIGSFAGSAGVLALFESSSEIE